MKKIKIAVMAGTPVDTKMGVQLLMENGYDEILEYPISENPEKQTFFQTSSLEEKEKLINDKIKNMKENSCDCLFVYCNSLSGAVNFKKLEKENAFKIITPMNIYAEIAKKYKRIAVISANAQGLSGIEKILFQNNDKIEIFGITLLEMVKEIENKTNPYKIAEKFNFKILIQYLESFNLDGILIGCTHFPYIKNEISKITKLEMIDPAKEMIKKLKE